MDAWGRIFTPAEMTLHRGAHSGACVPFPIQLNLFRGRASKMDMLILEFP